MTIEYDQLAKNNANYVALSPISLLHRTADVYGDCDSLIYRSRRYNWQQTRARCVRIASSLAQRGIGKNDTVSVFAYNTPEMFECHFAVPMAGAVLNTINTRLDADTVAYIIDHAETKLLIVDRGLWPILEQALSKTLTQPEIIVIDDEFATESEKAALPATLLTQGYDTLVEQGDVNYQWRLPDDEWQALSLNYTSGTTGRPKGVVYHHRGAYLMTMGTIASWHLPHRPSYLYTVPMFHCNGWGHAWTMAAKAAQVVCVRAFDPVEFFELVEDHNITHFGGAPIVLNMLASVPENKQKRFSRTVHAMTAGAPPPAKVLQSMSKLGFEVTHVYGLTESYGHILLAAPQDQWQAEPEEIQAELKSRQGVRFVMTEAVSVIDENGAEVKHDGESMGEIVIRGNTLMKGYLKNIDATQEVFVGDWFYSGDLAVIHPDGYIQVKDRAKDIIISGGENISSVEVENILYKHPAVGEAAVVAMADEKWGEVPCAFVELKANATASDQDLIDFCADNMARFKKPKQVVFGTLPKTATGKIQKTVLRQRCKES